jgi:hypothetical protein
VSAGLSELAGYAKELASALPWHGTRQHADLLLLAGGLTTLADAGDLTSEHSDAVRLLIRDTETYLFPLAVRVRYDPTRGFLVSRLDGQGEIWEYSHEAIAEETRQTEPRLGYLKARHRCSLHAPADLKNRFLFIYPAPNCPSFQSTCLLVEGPSDATFFGAMLDRIEPGWREIRSDSNPLYPAIEIRVAHGADNLPAVYDDLSDVYDKLRRESRFHTTRQMGASAERIVIVVDQDHLYLLQNGYRDRSGKIRDITRARHRVILTPDLERTSVSALVEAIGATTGRPLEAAEISKLEESAQQLKGDSFKVAIEKDWSVNLKSPAGGFPRQLAHAFPNRAFSDARSQRVWEACEQVLVLASGAKSIQELVSPELRAPRTPKSRRQASGAGRETHRSKSQ